jgi:hypothetical protein
MRRSAAVAGSSLRPRGSPDGAAHAILADGAPFIRHMLPPWLLGTRNLSVPETLRSPVDQSEHLSEDQVEQPQQHAGIMSDRQSPLVSDPTRLLAPHRSFMGPAGHRQSLDSWVAGPLLTRVARASHRNPLTR